MNPKWLMVVLVLASTPALACKFDAECSVGQQCLLRVGQTEGVCTSNRTPGSFDDGMPHDPADLTRSSPQSCDVDLDCGAMGKCMRSPGKVSGTCSGGAGTPGIHVQH